MCTCISFRMLCKLIILNIITCWRLNLACIIIPILPTTIHVCTSYDYFAVNIFTKDRFVKNVSFPNITPGKQRNEGKVTYLRNSRPQINHFTVITSCTSLLLRTAISWTESGEWTWVGVASGGSVPAEDGSFHREDGRGEEPVEVCRDKTS